jgi:hypothetical protein
MSATRKPALTADVFLAALAVLGGTSVACSRSERAAPAPDTPAAVSQPPAPPPAASPLTAAPTACAAAAPAGPSEEAKHEVDAGKEKAAGKPPPAKKAGAACGASGCSPDMKKGNK